MSVKQYVDEVLDSVDEAFSQAILGLYKACAEAQLAKWQEDLLKPKPANNDRRVDGTWKDDPPVFVSHLPSGHEGGYCPHHSWNSKIEADWYLNEKKYTAAAGSTSRNALNYLADRIKKKLNAAVGRKTFETTGNVTFDAQTNSINGRLNVVVRSGNSFDLVVTMTTEWVGNKPLFRFPVRIENVKIGDKLIEKASAKWMSENFE